MPRAYWMPIDEKLPPPPPCAAAFPPPSHGYQASSVHARSVGADPFCPDAGLSTSLRGSNALPSLSPVQVGIAGAAAMVAADPLCDKTQSEVVDWATAWPREHPPILEWIVRQPLINLRPHVFL